eukprot:3887206-Prymnesium_polylepis.1
MARNDVRKFLILFVAFLMNYGITMYITFPKAATPDPEVESIVPQFSSFVTALQAMIELAMTGAALKLDLDSNLPNGDPRDWIDRLNTVAKKLSFG